MREALLALVGFILVAIPGFARPAGYLQAPAISEIRPSSMKVTWVPYDSFDTSTHYQVRIDHALFGASLTGTSATVTHLNPGRTYKVDVVTYHRGVILGISSPAAVLTGPAAPQTVYATDVTTSTFVLHWTPVSTATGYHVADAAGKIIASAGASETSILLTGFSPGQSVSVRVVAENPSSLSEPSKSVTVVLKPRPPDLTVNADQIGSASLLVSWTPVEGAASYSILIGTTTYAVVASSVSSLRIDGLEPGSSMTVTIIAENAGGSSVPSAGVTVQLRPGTPEQPWVTNLASFSFVLNWRPVNGAESYQVFNGAWHLANVSASLTSTLVKGGFNAGEIATITLVARNRTGDSARSPAVFVTFPSPTASGSVSSVHAFMAPPHEGLPAPGDPMPDIRLEDADGRRFSLGSLHRRDPLAVMFWNDAEQGKTIRISPAFRSLASDPALSAFRFMFIHDGRIPTDIDRSNVPSSTAEFRLLSADFDPAGDAPLCIVVGTDGTVLKTFRIISAEQARDELLLCGVSGNVRLQIERSRFERLHRLDR